MFITGNPAKQRWVERHETLIHLLGVSQQSDPLCVTSQLLDVKCGFGSFSSPPITKCLALVVVEKNLEM